jgi:hypothetical protein
MASNVDDLKKQLGGFDLMMMHMLDKCLASRHGGPPPTRPWGCCSQRRQLVFMSANKKIRILQAHIIPL